MLAADTRAVSGGEGQARDGVRKLRTVPWGLVAGGGRADVIARVLASFGRRPNPSLAELQAVLRLAVVAAGPAEPATTELLFSYEPRGPAQRGLPTAAAAAPASAGPVRVMPIRVALCRGDVDQDVIVTAQIAVLPPRDLDRAEVVRWIRRSGDLGGRSGEERTLRGAVSAALHGFTALAPQSAEVSPDLDLGVHEEGRRFRVARVWW